MKKVEEKAYAKINLVLNIGDLRPDGYHDIQTIMQSLELHDDVTVEQTGGTGITVTASVDRVTAFDDPTPMALIQRLKPDVLIKGADYTKDKVVGAAEVESWGGEVRLADFADGYSTTKTIEKMTGAPE